MTYFVRNLTTLKHYTKKEFSINREILLILRTLHKLLHTTHSSQSSFSAFLFPYTCISLLAYALIGYTVMQKTHTQCFKTNHCPIVKVGDESYETWSLFTRDGCFT